MSKALEVSSALFGALFAVVGLTLLVAPRTLVGQLGIEPVGLVGMATVRGDLAGVFLATVVLIVVGLWRRQPTFLAAAALIRGLIATGHLVGLALDGAATDLIAPVLLEVIATAVLAATALRLKSAATGD